MSIYEAPHGILGGECADESDESRLVVGDADVLILCRCRNPKSCRSAFPVAAAGGLIEKGLARDAGGCAGSGDVAPAESYGSGQAAIGDQSVLHRVADVDQRAIRPIGMHGLLRCAV